MSLRSLITDLKEDTKKKFGGVNTAGSLSNKFWQSKAANNLASWQTLLSDPKSKIKFGQDYRYNPQDTRLQKANKWAGNVIKNAGESIVTMVPKVGYDIGQLGKGIVTGNTNNIEFSSAPARFGEDLSTYFVKDETGKPIRKPFDTVGYYGRGKWNVPFTQIKLPEMGFTESSAFSTGVKGVQAFEAPLAAKGLLNPLKLLTMAGFSSTIGGAANYVGSGAKEGSFEEGAWQTAYSMGPTLAKSSGLLSATDKFTTLGSVPMQSVTNVLQGIAYDKMSGTETTGGSIFIDALFPIASDVSGKAFKSFTEAAKTIQGKVLTGLGKHLRKSDGTYTTLAKWVKGTRPYRKGSAGALFGFEITQNEDGTWKVGFNDKKALAGIAIMTGGTKALKNLDSKSLGDNAGKNELEDILKAQEMKANKVAPQGKIYKDYQDIHNAVKAGELKIGDKVATSSYGGLNVEIAPPDYEGELNEIGTLLKYKIKEVGGGAQNTKDLDPLIQEARKYKSAEEFVKSMSTLNKEAPIIKDIRGYKISDLSDRIPPTNNDGTITLYHATTKDGADSILKSGFKGSRAEEGNVFFTTDQRGGQFIGADKNTIIETKIRPEKLLQDISDTNRHNVVFSAKDTDIIGVPTKIVENPKPTTIESQLTDIWNQANKVGGGVKIPVDRARSLSPSSRNQYKENGILNTNKVQDITKIAQGTPEVLPKSPYSSLSSKQIITQNGAKIKEPTTIAEIEKTLYGSETVAPVSGTKTSVGFLGNKLRTIENLASDRVAKGLTSNNKYVRGIATVLQDLFGGAGKSQGQIVARAEYRGGIDYATKVANDSQKYVYDLLENDTKSLERVHAFLDPSISKIKVSEASLKPNEKEAVAYLRVVSDFINDTNYKNGFISKELWAKNKGGKYIARAYEPFDYPPEVADFIKDKSIRFDLNPFKQRGKVTDWKIENSIKDPAYLMSKRLQQTMFNSEVGKYTSWAKNSGLISDTAKPGFVQLSDSKAYGEVAGKWIRKDALEDVKGFFLTNDIAQKSYDILKWYDRNPARKLQKSLKTVFNPAVRLGNRTGNYVFAWLNGINPATFAKNKFWANAAIKNNDPMYRRAVQLGLTGTDVTKADIARISAELKRGINDKNVLSEIDGIIKESYGRVDDSSKLAAYKTWLDRGFTEKEAVNRARRGFQDYSMVGFLYDVGARLPVLGNPFVRFSAESIRIAKNAVIDHPIRAISTIAAWKIFTEVMSRISGETDEERTIREKRVGAAHVPFTNISMNVQTPWGEVNASRLIGFSTTFTPEDSMVPDVSKYAPIQNPLDVRSYGSDPLIGPLISIATDKDFRGKSIADPNQNKYQGSLLTDSERNKNRLGYLARSYAPPTITDIYNIGSAFQGQPNVYGQVKTPTQAILRTYPGVKVEQFGSEQVKSYKEREKKYNEYLLKSIDSKIRSIQKDIDSGTLDPIVGRKRIEALQKQKITEVSTSIRRFEESPEAPKTIPEKVKLAAQGIGADPLNTIKAIFTEERMRKISGNALILEREESLNKTPSEDDAVDHIIPLSLGGDNSKSNLRYISKEANREKAKLETKLARQLANKEITKSEARKQIKEWVDTYESGSTYTSADTSTDTEKSSTSESTPTYEGGYIEYTVGESKKKVKKTISMPKLTSNNELNKKIISDYKSDLTDYENYIMYQYESGAITEEKAGLELERIAYIKKALSNVTKSGSGKAKKVNLAAISQKILKPVKVEVKSPKFNTFEVLSGFNKVKAPNIKAPNLAVPKFDMPKFEVPNFMKGTK